MEPVITDSDSDTRDDQEYRLLAARSSVLIWALDFWRAFEERPWYLRAIARLAVGRWAWRELLGMREALGRAGMDVAMPYDLEHMAYHTKPRLRDGAIARIRPSRYGRRRAR
jgi:hypothetical protein